MDSVVPRMWRFATPWHAVSIRPSVEESEMFAASDMVSEMISTMERDSAIAVVSPKIFFAHKPDMLWYAGGGFNFWTGGTRHRGWKQVDHGQFDHRLAITQATGCAMMVRCNAMREVGLLDEQFWAYAEDVDWSLRFSEHGYLLHHIMGISTAPRM